MRAQAYDLGEPQLTGAEVNITIFVIGNDNPPFFVNAPYFRTLDENFGVGELVYDTSASDRDTQVNLSYCQLVK
jgi:hypothetical protein